MKRHSLEGRGATLPAFQKPQLATLADTVPPGDDWLHETKFDGYRCIAAVAGNKVCCYSRSGLDWTEKFRRIAEHLPALQCRSALLDGEVIVRQAAPGSQFSALQSALSSGGSLAYCVFDLLEIDGADLKSRPLVERKELLRKLVASLPRDGPILYSDHVRGSGQSVLDAMCKAGREGTIAKKANSPYRGTRTTSWLKLKCTRRQEFVIGGYSPSDKRGRPFASLLIGTFENDALIYRGRVGSGFSGAHLDDIQAVLKPLEQKVSPFHSLPASVSRNAHWVRPELVVEIDFTELTDGGHVRHGVFKGIREDKRPSQVTLERAPSGKNTEPEERAKPGRVKAGGKEKAGTKAEPVTVKSKDEFHGVRISNPQRVVFPKQGITKADLAAYYDAVAERILPHTANHPLSLVRCPDGRNDKCFFQKHASPGFPDALKRVKLREKSGKRSDYLYVDGIQGLIAAVQMGTLEFHIWGSRIDALGKPDRVVFDLDPDESLDFPVVSLAAAVLRERLSDLGLQTVALVTGGKGVHVIAPLRRTAEWPEVKSFALAFAARLAADEPDIFVATASKAKRRGRIFVDWLRNERGATAIAPYSTRAREGGPVATPVTWDELKVLKAANGFLIKDVARRVNDANPWEESLSWRQSITAKMLRSFD